MTRFTFGILASALLATVASAQTQLVRGEVDGIQGTANLFQLDATHIRLVSSTLNLQTLHDATHQNDMQLEMQVVQIGSNPTTLDVVSANVVPEMFSMGNLRFGDSNTWELFGPSGAQYAVFVNFRANTSYAPIGAAGTWVLGASIGVLQSGTIGPFGQVQFQFTMPDSPSLLGVEVSSQAVMVEGGSNLIITNPDSKTVED